jgi:GntR family transcriptional regulator
MAGQWKVSRCTVRQALSALVRDGIIERRQGKGTFVVHSEALRDFIGYYALEGSGDEAIRFNTRVLSFERVDPPPEVCEYLRVMPGVQVLRLKLLRLANKTPAILLTSYMSAEACANLKEEDFLTYQVLTQVLTNCCGIPVVSQRRSVRPVKIEGEEAELLDVQPGSLGLHMERLSYSDFRQPVEYGTTVVRGDLITYSLDIGRAGGALGQVLPYKGGSKQDQF